MGPLLTVLDVRVVDAKLITTPGGKPISEWGEVSKNGASVKKAGLKADYFPSDNILDIDDPEHETG